MPTPEIEPVRWRARPKPAPATAMRAMKPASRVLSWTTAKSAGGQDEAGAAGQRRGQQAAEEELAREADEDHEGQRAGGEDGGLPLIGAGSSRR